LASEGLVYRQATTLTLAAIVFCQIGMVLNCRTERESIFKVGIFSNMQVMKGIIAEIILIIALMYIPALHGIFNTAPIGWPEWIFLLCLPVPVVLIEEARKYFVRRYAKI
jgi:Ca2+-transporting ATPase